MIDFFFCVILSFWDMIDFIFFFAGLDRNLWYILAEISHNFRRNVINRDQSGQSPQKWGYPNKVHAQWSKDVTNFNRNVISDLLQLTIFFEASFFSVQSALLYWGLHKNNFIIALSNHDWNSLMSSDWNEFTENLMN